MSVFRVFAATLMAAFACQVATASYVIEIDTDGADDAVLTFSPNFSFGGDTTSASQSAASPAVGMTGGDSIFGGNGVNEPDTYLFTYTPGADGDNRAIAAGTALNSSGDLATGLTAGGSGIYNIYATWPFTTNVSGGATTFRLSDGTSNLFSVDIDQNGTGGEWILLGQTFLDSGTTYELFQEAGSNTFVSMRSAGVLFDITAIPEPSSMAVLMIGSVTVLMRRRR